MTHYTGVIQFILIMVLIFIVVEIFDNTVGVPNFGDPHGPPCNSYGHHAAGC